MFAEEYHRGAAGPGGHGLRLRSVLGQPVGGAPGQQGENKVVVIGGCYPRLRAINLPQLTNSRFIGGQSRWFDLSWLLDSN